MPIGRVFSTIAAALLAGLAATAARLAQICRRHRLRRDGRRSRCQRGRGRAGPRSREFAMRGARRFGLLVDRMVSAEDRARLPQIDDVQLENMVRGVEFVRERSVARSLRRHVERGFRPDAVKSYLSGSGVKVVETVARPALVIPLWKGRRASSRSTTAMPGARPGSSSTVPAVRCRSRCCAATRPTRTRFRPEEAYVGDVSALARLNERYRAPTIIVATVEGDKASGRAHGRRPALRYADRRAQRDPTCLPWRARPICRG